MNYYLYYSYEPFGRGYIGSRACRCLPEEDIKYFGSFTDKTFKPTEKIIINKNYKTREELLKDETLLHEFFQVDKNPQFANKAKQTSKRFYYVASPDDAKRWGKITLETKTGIYGLSEEKLKESRSKGAKITNAQKWQCTETGFVSNAGALSCYQKKHGIDVSKRKRIL